MLPSTLYKSTKTFSTFIFERLPARQTFCYCPFFQRYFFFAKKAERRGMKKINLAVCRDYVDLTFISRTQRTEFYSVHILFF